MIPDYDRHDHSFGKYKIADPFPGPDISRSDADPEKAEHIVILIFAQKLELRVLLDESGADDTGRDGHHSDAQESDDNTEEFSQRRDRVDISVSYCQQRR